MAEMEMEDLTTRWFNPTEHTFNFKVFVGPGTFRRVIVKPKQEIALPSEWDDAIATRAKGSNVVTGGLCPQLRRVKDTETNVHPSILGVERAPNAPAPSAAAANALQTENAELKERLARLEKLVLKEEAPAPAARPAKQQGPKPTEAAT